MSRLQDTRREFLRASAGAAAMGLAAPYAWTSAQARATSKNDRPTVAAIGVGGKGSGNGRAAARFADMAACCDVDRSHAERFAASREFQGGRVKAVEFAGKK